jgi:uncharacterized protein (TIGR02687 family)
MQRVHDSLERVFEKNRIVFWYDPEREWSEAFETFACDGIVKLTVDRNEFGTKVRIVRHRDRNARFLVYVPAPKPADADNWLLDLLLSGHEFKADQASLAALDVGFTQELAYLAKEHHAFFRSEKRSQELRERLEKGDLTRDVRMKMMAILAGTEIEIDALVLHFLSETAQESSTDEEESADLVTETLGASGLEEAYWGEAEQTFGYSSLAPSVRDFGLWLFRAANPLDGAIKLQAHTKVFLQRWKDSQRHSKAYRAWANRMERELKVLAALDKVQDASVLSDCDTFEAFDKFIIHQLAKAFAAGAKAEKIREILANRKTSFWRDQHDHGYAAIENALDLRESIESAELSIGSIEEGARRYVATWWRIDQAYRHCTYHTRSYGQVQVLEPVTIWAQKAYVNNYLLPVADRWSDQVAKVSRWDCEALPAQSRFFDRYVSPFLRKGRKVVVVVSDALRFEAAEEFARRLQTWTRWTAETEALFGALPSYTQLGMACLLPGNLRAIDPSSGVCAVDGQSAAGTENRGKILSAACGGRGLAIQARDFVDLNKTDGSVMMRDHDVVYVYHNRIDETGDKAGTEERTFDAVKETLDDLERIVKKAANLNATNMVVTADHGFLFQQDGVPEADMLPPPASAQVSFQDRRFALGNGINHSPGIIVFSSDQLSVGGDWSAAFPRSIGRFRLKGSGKRYVHGGITLQEVIVPVVKVHKSRADDTQVVEVEFLSGPNSITTGQVAIALFQDRPAVDKVLPRSLRIGVYADDGTALSERKTVMFNSSETEPRKRESHVLLALSNSADTYNGKEVEIRLESMPAGTAQWVPYKVQRLKLQKPFASDFDEF